MSDPLTDEASRYASRKWILAAATLVLVFLLMVSGLMTEAGFIDVVKWTLGLYFGANVGQKAATSIASAIEKKGGAE